MVVAMDDSDAFLTVFFEQPERTLPKLRLYWAG